jgi:Sec-independent protein translocase protein TatA
MESIFGIGGPELLLILVLATIVLGPLRMIRAARQLGILLRDLRNYYQQLTSGLSEELAALDDLGKVDLNLGSITAPLSEPARSTASSQEPTAPTTQSQSSAPSQEATALVEQAQPVASSQESASPVEPSLPTVPNQEATAPAEQSQSIAPSGASTAPAEPVESSPVQAGGNAEGTLGNNTDQQP